MLSGRSGRARARSSLSKQSGTCMQALVTDAGCPRICKPPWGGVVYLASHLCTAAALGGILEQAVRFGTSWKFLTAQERNALEPHVLAHSAVAGVVVAHHIEGGGHEEAEQEEWHIRSIDKRCENFCYSQFHSPPQPKLRSMQWCAHSQSYGACA